MILLSAYDSWFHVMTINEISRNRSEMIFGFRIIPWWVVWEFVFFSSKNSLFFSSARDDPLIKVDGLWRRSPPGVLTVPSATGKRKMSPFQPSGVEFWCVHLLQFFNVHNQPVCLLSRFLPRTILNREVKMAGFLLQIDVISRCLSQR